MWFFSDERQCNGKKLWEEEAYKLFVKKKVGDICPDEHFLAVALIFFRHAKEERDPSLAIPSTIFMELLNEEQIKVAQKNYAEIMAPLKGLNRRCNIC